MQETQETALAQVTINTDGAGTGNPGPGGWGAILVSGTREKELSGGEARTTNNRMELTAVIQGLSALKRPCHPKGQGRQMEKAGLDAQFQGKGPQPGSLAEAAGAAGDSPGHLPMGPRPCGTSLQ